MSAAEAEPTLIGSVQRALRLVDIVANSPRPLPPKMLAAITGLTPGTTYNLVRTLVHEGYLSSEPDGVVLGTRFPSFQQQISSRGVFLARVRAALREVTEDVGATAYLSRFDDGEMHMVDIVDAVRNPRIELWVGLQSSALMRPRWASRSSQNSRKRIAWTTSRGIVCRSSHRAPSPIAGHC